MNKDVQYISLYEVLSRVLRHPMLQDTTLEEAIQYTVDFIHTFGMPDMFETKETVVELENYRGELPCDLVSVNQVMDLRSHTCLRSTTNTFNPERSNGDCVNDRCIDNTFKIQNRVIFSSIEKGLLKVNYNSIPVDENGYPYVINDPVYLKALESYIKKEVFTVLFDLGKITPAVLSNTQQEYSWRAGMLQSEFNIPSDAEMQSIINMWTQLVQTTTEADNGYKNLGSRNYIKRH